MESKPSPNSGKRGGHPVKHGCGKRHKHPKGEQCLESTPFEKASGTNLGEGEDPGGLDSGGENVLEDEWRGSQNSCPLFKDGHGNICRQAGVLGRGITNLMKIFKMDRETMVDEST